MLSRHVEVLHLQTWGMNSAVMFSRLPDEPDDSPTMIGISPALHIEMGEPSTITLTLTPGDELNEPAKRGPGRPRKQQ